MNLSKLLAAAAMLAFGSAWGQSGKFPDHTIRIIVPFAAGGGVDSAARLLANQIGAQLRVPVIVDNRAGASGTLGARAVQASPADGYTLLFSAATHVLAKQVMSHVSYDPQTDFAPVARVGEAPLLLVISPNLPQRNLAEVLAAAKQQPESWTAGIPAAGAPSHLATLLLAEHAGVRFAFIPYKGTQPALIDVAGGNTHLLMDSMISLLPLAKSAKVKPIAVSSARRTQLAPEVPTLQEGGVKMSYSSWYGVWAPKNTSPERVRLLNSAINTAVREVAKTGGWSNLGIEPVTETIEQFARFIARDAAQGAELLKNAGFKPE